MERPEHQNDGTQRTDATSEAADRTNPGRADADRTSPENGDAQRTGGASDATGASASTTWNGRTRTAGVPAVSGQVTVNTTRPTPGRIEVATVDESFRGRWNDVVERSPQGTPFHQYEFVQTIGRHVDADLYALVGRDEDGPVGIFPLFGWQPAGPVDVAVSPPPNMGLYSLGPVALTDGTAVRDQRRNCRFVEACLDWLRDERDPWYVHVETSHRYGDVRPFAWHGYEVTPRYTYLVDLDRDEEDLFMSFSGDARSNVRTCRDADCSVRTGGREDVARIVDSVNDRYEEQDVAFSLDPAFVTDLYYSLPDGQVRPYVITTDGEFAGGMVVLEFEETVYRWQGGTVPDVDLPVNDYLDWYIMQDAIERGLQRYDLVGANTERLCEYKAKFDPALASYYRITGGNRVVRAIAGLFDGSGGLHGSAARFARQFLPD